MSGGVIYLLQVIDCGTVSAMQEEKNMEQEWQWCLVGNIVEEHEYGENHEIRCGTKQFRPNAKVYINLVYGGMGHENILVIGMPRHSYKYIEIVIKMRYVKNFRLQKVFKPSVLERMKLSEWDWWGNTDVARDRLIKVLEWLNPAEAEKAKSKFTYLLSDDNNDGG